MGGDGSGCIREDQKEVVVERYDKQSHCNLQRIKGYYLKKYFDGRIK